MNLFLSDFKLPKEYSKKKKISISVGICTPATDKNPDVEWKINKDRTRFYLTIEDAIQAALNDKVHQGCNEKNLNKSTVAVLTLEFPVTEFNDRPCMYAHDGTAMDAEFDPTSLSFLVTLQGRTEEEAHIVLFSVDSVKIEEVTSDNGESSYKVADFKAYPKVNGALA